MRRSNFILLLGLLLGGVAFFAAYHLGTARCRHMMNNPQPELAWLQREFGLGPEEFARVSKLHEAYLPQCAERCRLIEQANAKLTTLLATNNTVTPEIQNLLYERARIRAQCEAEMLQHFQAVSRAMPQEQGRRYLQWVEGQTLLRAQAMEARHQNGAAHEHMSHSH